MESDLFDGLSPSSVRRPAVQGGPMSTAERGAFESAPYFDDAVALRRFDQRGKDPGLLVDGFGTYRELLVSVAGGAPPTVTAVFTVTHRVAVARRRARWWNARERQGWARMYPR